MTLFLMRAVVCLMGVLVFTAYWVFYSERPSLILPTIIGTVVLTVLILWSKPANAD